MLFRLKQARAPGLRNLHLELVVAAGDAGDAGVAAARFVVQHISSLEASLSPTLPTPHGHPWRLCRAPTFLIFPGLAAEGPKSLRPQSGVVQWHPQSPEPSEPSEPCESHQLVSKCIQISWYQKLSESFQIQFPCFFQISTDLRFTRQLSVDLCTIQLHSRIW